MKNNIVLVKTLLLSTSRINSCKYCRDKKKRGKMIGGMIGEAMLYILLMAYCVSNCIGFGFYGLADAIPVTCALVISGLSLVLTFFKANGYLFGFKEYDMLMSLPFEPKDIAACKFMYMYIKSIPWYMSVSVSMLICYGVYAKPSAAVYPVWLILSLLLPIIPMLAAAFLGFIIARLGSGFKNKTIVQTALMMLLIFIPFVLRFFLEDMFRNNKTEAVMNSVSDATGKAGSVYLPVKWFSSAVTELDVLGMLLLIGATVLLFELIFIPVGRSYRKINSALGSHAASGKFEMSEQKSRSIVSAIAFKEFRRMVGSTTYLTNAAFGEVMCFIGGIAVLFIDIDTALPKLLQNAPITKEMLYPAIPLIVHFMINMVATTAITPSLEGKNYWIVQSLPIGKRTLYKGKMLFNFCLTVPFMLFAVTTISISAKAPFLNTVMYLILGLCLCAFSTAWGCVCGIKHLRLDWENEIEIVKQSTALMVYLFPNMFITMALIVLVVYLGTIISSLLVTLILIFAVSILALLSYLRVMALAKE